MSSPSVALIGPGEVGSYVARGLAARTDRTLIICSRRPRADLAAFEVRTDASQASPVLWVLLCVKAHQTASAAPWLRALSTSKTTVAVLQNGVEHEDRVAPFVGEAKVLPVVVRGDWARPEVFGRDLESKGGQLIVPGGPEGEAFAQLFDGTGLHVARTSDFRTAAWTKLCLNAAIDAVTVPSALPLGAMLAPDAQERVRGLLVESVGVARAAGASLLPADAERLKDELLAMARANPDGRSSMVKDALAGRQLEVDARAGAVVRFGRRTRTPTPLYDAVAAQLQQ